MGHLCGNGIRQSQAAAWWDVVVRGNAAEHGKATRGALFRYECCVLGFMGEWHHVMADDTLNIGTLEDGVLAILCVCVSKLCTYFVCDDTLVYDGDT